MGREHVFKERLYLFVCTVLSGMVQVLKIMTSIPRCTFILEMKDVKYWPAYREAMLYAKQPEGKVVR
jgi:hypothetical protein